MATLRAIRKRIKSAKNIQQITKAMKMVAAAKLRKAQERILMARTYANKIREVIFELIIGIEENSYPLLIENADVKKEAVLLITSDKGLCGSFNSNLIKETMLKMKENNDINFIFVGKKGMDYFKRFNFNKEIELFKYNDKKIDWYDVEEIGNLLINNYLKKNYRKVHLIYSEFQTSLQQKVKKEILLPVKFEPQLLENKIEKRDFLYEPDEKTVLNALLERYIKNNIFRAILESQAAEHGVRMVSMEMATNNAGDMIKSLTLLANKTRQASITKEISEIVGGAEAVK
jgi:F-type H+-transporting ATPase subunit gamma